MVDLRYLMQTAHMDCGETRHALDVMAGLGVKYEQAIPQSVADQWWFLGCTNAPDPLPKYLEPMTQQEAN